MLVLVVTKTTNYELHGALVEAKLEQGRISRTVSGVAPGRISTESLQRLKVAHEEHYASLARLHEALARHHVDYVEVTREHESPPPGNYEAVITVGGDGTLLSASHRMVNGGKIYGIRSSTASVGYLSCTGPEGIDALVRGILAQSVPMAMVQRLSASIDRIDTAMTEVTLPVLNDFLYTNTNPAATSLYKLNFRGQTETQRSSGIWVSTAVGSTAAILTAGGSRQAFDDRLCQFKVRELYRLGHVHPVLDGSLFDPDQAQDLLEIENRCPEAMLALDGQHGSVTLNFGDVVRFQRAAPLHLGRPINPGR